jgi:alkanesulfonate monooxygenase SsuD/methylene tetrahydromethanopterin reductase-like flavin-dependent oxidoreductase (luciferase family)
MIAAAVQRTRRMRFGNYVNALPFHHPLRLAAEAAMLDNLANGRFDFGVGKGVRPGEFAQLGLRFEDAPAMTEEAIEILVKAWTHERASHAGRFWTFPEFSLRPRVLQRPHPPLHEVASKPASAARVGARGWPVAMHFTPTDVVARCVEDYRAALARRAGPPGTGPSAARPTWPRRPSARGPRARWGSKGSGISRRSPPRLRRASSPTPASRS